MKSFTTYQWLVFIKKLENKSEEELYKFAKDKIHLNMLQNTNWHLLILDLSIRISDDKNTKVNFNDLPTEDDYYIFIKLYTNSYDVDNGINFSKDLDYSVPYAMSKMTYEQLKMYSPIGGRLITLYGSIKNKIKEEFGLFPNQIAIFYLLNDIKNNIYVPFNFNEIFKYLNIWDNTISEKNLKKFIVTFSITLKEYKLKAEGITKNNIKSKRLISNIPILDLTNNYYFIPSKSILQEALTYRIFETIDKRYKGSETFKRKFGDTFENYIRELTQVSHGSYFNECNKLMQDRHEKKKAEFFLSKGNSSIVIESKSLYLDEEIILHDSALKLDKKMNNRIKDAILQIESCFNYLCTKNNYGIIVIHTHIPMLNYMLSKNKVNIILMSIIDFEIIIHNPYEKIIEYFKKENKDKNITLFFKKENPYLKEIWIKLLSDVEKNQKSSKDFKNEK